MDFLRKLWDSIVEFFLGTTSGQLDVPVETPKVQKVSKAKLGKLTKAQLSEKGKELGVDVDQRQLKSKIVNEVYKAQ